jgi:MoaA/NifB/PqqE/SkfB family radical SAM enzyme
MNSSSLNKDIYSDLKVFHYQEFLDNLSDGTNSPLHIRIKPTNRCNHNCSYCAFRNPNQSIGDIMNQNDYIPYSKMLEIIQDIISMGVRAVTFSGGGEPTTYPRFAEIVNKIAESKIKFAMLTNGSLFSDDIADIFAKKGSWVRVSIDGWDRESYKNFRGADDFDRVIENIHNFKSSKCLLGVNIVVNKDNAEHLYDLYKVISSANISTIKISPCVVSDSIYENTKYHDPLKNTVENETRRIYSDSKIHISNTYQEQLNGFLKNYTWCPNIQIRPVIGADQCIYSCHDKAYKKDGLLGSFKNTSFKDAWERANKFKINPNKVCKHHCIAHNKNTIVLSYLEIYRDHISFV